MTEESMPKLLGIDVGSTTVKVSVIDGENIIYGSYVRHFSKVKETVLAELKKIKEAYPGDYRCSITGSARLWGRFWWRVGRRRPCFRQ